MDELRCPRCGREGCAGAVAEVNCTYDIEYPPRSEPGAEGLVLVRKDSGGVFPDGTTNTPAIDFGASEAATPAADSRGLDVERLRQAIDASALYWNERVIDNDNTDMPLMEATLDTQRYAEDIAREYAAFTDPEPGS